MAQMGFRLEVYILIGGLRRGFFGGDRDGSTLFSDDGKWKMENGKWEMENGKGKREQGSYFSHDVMV